MKKICKKAVALIIALALMVSMCVSVAAAIDATLVLEPNKTDIYEDDIFTLTMKINATGVTGLRNGALYITYPSNVIVPCDSTGAELTTWNDGDTSIMATSVADSHFIASNKVSNAENVGKLSLEILMNNKNSPAIAVTEGSASVLSFWFMAKEKGEATISLDAATGETGFIATEDDLTLAYTPTVITVKDVPDYPTISGQEIAGELKDGKTLEVNYTFDNGEETDTTSKNATTYVWKADGVAIKNATEKTYTLTGAEIGKVITCEVTPKANRTPAEKLHANGEMVVVTTEGKVMPREGYKPVVTADAIAKIFACVEVAPVINFDADYEAVAAVADYSATYDWYLVAAETTTVPETEPFASPADGKITFEVEDKDAVAADATYAMLVVTPVANVAGTEIPGDATIVINQLIEGEPPVLTPNIDTAKKIRVGNTLSAVIAEADADITVDNKYPAGAEITGEPEVTYLWEVVGPDSVIRTGNEATFKLTKEDVGYNVRVTINYANAMEIPADELVITWDLAVEKKAGGAPAAGTGANLSAPTTTPGTETPGTDKPGTETPGTETPGADVKEDPAGTANDKGAAVFTDVDKEAYAWAYEGIDVLTKSGVIKGMTESTFGPELTATNAQMIALAVRIAGLTAEGATTDKVDAEHWVAAELAVADAKGILGVYGDKVDAEGEVTREIAFTLLYNALKAAGAELAETAEAIEFTDAASIDANCVEAINALVKAGIVNGMGDGTLAPKATLTRAQLAKILGMANAIVAK